MPTFVATTMAAVLLIRKFGLLNREVGINK